MKEYENDRRLIQKRDIILISAIVFLCVGVMVWHSFFKPAGALAQITVDGNLFKTVDLLTQPDGIYEINAHAKYEIKEHKIRFADSDCNDKICENTGWISSQGSIAVCLPNKITIKVLGKASDVDIIVD